MNPNEDGATVKLLLKWCWLEDRGIAGVLWALGSQAGN